MKPRNRGSLCWTRFPPQGVHRNGLRNGIYDNSFRPVGLTTSPAFRPLPHKNTAGFPHFLRCFLTYLYSSTIWQATLCPGFTSLKTGASCLHFSVACGQRVENAQPLKSSVLTGCSPESSENPSRSIYGSGTEAKRPFVYGWSGFANNSSVSVSSTSVPPPLQFPEYPVL